MNTKYYINGQSLRNYCIENGLSNKEYNRCKYLCLYKHLTPEEALVYKRYPNGHIDRKQQCLRNHRRFLGYSESELDLSTEELREIRCAKNGSVFYHGHILSWWAKKYNISKGCLYYRVVKQAMSILEAVKIPTRSQQIIKYKGKSIYEIFDKNTAHRIMYRVNYLGWSIEDAVNIPPLSKQQSNKYRSSGSFGCLKNILKNN